MLLHIPNLKWNFVTDNFDYPESYDEDLKSIKADPDSGKFLLLVSAYANFTHFLLVLDSKSNRLCPYLDTINRPYLDFDFEKLCSVSLTRINVYACLVCGKYFQGRGTNTHAYTHSVAESHHVFLNLHTLKFYCLPDNYEIVGKRFQGLPIFSERTVCILQILHWMTSNMF